MLSKFNCLARLNFVFSRFFCLKFGFEILLHQASSELPQIKATKNEAHQLSQRRFDNVKIPNANVGETGLDVDS